MKKEDLVRLGGQLLPVVTTVFVAVCAVVSLSDYEAPVYAVEKEKEESTEVVQSTETTVSAGEIEETQKVKIQGKFELEDGVYQGKGTGFAGEVTVAVEIKDGSIVSIEVLSNSDGAAFFNRAKGVIDAMIQSQSFEVDAVSGATFSSNGIINAVKKALTGEEEASVSTNAVKGSFEIADGVYKGTGVGFRGNVVVSVEVKDGSIVKIDIVSASDDAAFFNRAKAVIDAIIGSQSLEVDAVSGATYSSKGIINAVKNALTGEVDTSSTGSVPQPVGELPEQKDIKEPDAYKNGTYYGTGTGFGGTIKVKVVIKKGKISSIKIVSHSDDGSYMDKASALIKKMISKQTTNVDTVSGATYSSAGLIEAVRDALSQAEKDSDDKKDESDDKKKDDSDDKENDDSQVTGTVPYVDGIYYGTAEGYVGDITVAVVIQEKTMKAILVTESEDDEAFFTRAMDVVKNVMKQQNTDVDTVSGATYSSQGLLNAIKNALEVAKKVTNGEAVNTVNKETLQATIAEAEALKESDYTALSWEILKIRLQDAKEASNFTQQEHIDKAEKKLRSAINKLVKKPAEEESGTGTGAEDGTGTENGTEAGNEAPTTKYIDGTYEATVLCVPDAFEDFESYNLTLKVTVENDKITSVTDITGDGDSKNDRYIDWAANGRANLPGVVTQIVEKGTTEEVDAVSKATCSSVSIIEACKKALESALRQ